MSGRRVKKSKPLPGTMNELTDRLVPLAITSERGYREMLRWIDELAVLDKRTKAQDRFLTTLAILVEAYEDEHYRIDTEALGAIDPLKFLMEQHEMSGRDLGRILGQPQLGGKILRGERDLSKAHIRKLCAHFGVGPELFF